MARVLVFTDRLPHDPECKGAITWQIILSLAESQHEVLVVTTKPLEHIEFTHPRLTVTRPAESWRVDQFPRLARAVLTFQPQVIHTFALEDDARWPSLTVWPYLHAFCLALPGCRRFLTLFEAEDLARPAAARLWHQGASTVTVFHEELRRGLPLAPGQTAEWIPLELRASSSAATGPGAENRIVIPAPVGRWTNVDENLRRLALLLQTHKDCDAYILGGWGDLPALQRKRGWSLLQNVLERVHHTESAPFPELSRELQNARKVWLEPLDARSWTFLLAARLAQECEAPVFSGRLALPSRDVGSTANHLSRLYTA